MNLITWKNERAIKTSENHSYEVKNNHGMNLWYISEDWLTSYEEFHVCFVSEVLSNYGKVLWPPSSSLTLLSNYGSFLFTWQATNQNIILVVNKELMLALIVIDITVKSAPLDVYKAHRTYVWFYACPYGPLQQS